MVILFGEKDVTVFYKITTEAEWALATAKGVFAGSALDLKDGYIHLSTAEQARETARLHFGGQENLVLVAVPEDAVASALKWEASRGGKMFPHVYATLDPASALWVKPLPWNGTAHDFPKEFEI
jgi:uncharacterized protein (DUF952 family)